MKNDIDKVACKAAGRKLYSELEDTVHLMEVGIGSSEDKQSYAIYIMVFDQEDVDKVPSEYKGFEVKVSVTGEIRPL